MVLRTQTLILMYAMYIWIEVEKFYFELLTKKHQCYK
jgi:hypothetical protein